MKMRWIVVINIHIDDYSIESTYFRHIFYLFKLFHYAKINNLNQKWHRKITFFFFVCISMFKNALHLHHREGDGEQVGGQAILP